MSSSDGLNADLSLRSRRKRAPLLVLAAALLLFAAVAGASLLLLRPITLRIAVGPSGSDDQKLIQALAQSFAREGSPVRLSLITTGGPVSSIALLGAGKTDLAVTRGDEEMPAGTNSLGSRRSTPVFRWRP